VKEVSRSLRSILSSSFVKVSSKYYSEKAVLICEVLSETTRQFDLSDKFIQYPIIERLANHPSYIQQ